MPRLSGPALDRRLSITRPGIPVVYMSGYSPERGPEAFPEPRATVLQKPFSPKLLDAEIRKLLDHEPAVAHRPRA